MAQASEEPCEITDIGLIQFGIPARPFLSSLLREETIGHISCGHQHSAVVCESGRVFTFGGNGNGELGLGAERVTVEEPTPVDALGSSHITQAACGEHYTLFLSAKGEVFACGRNDFGQLGLGHKTDVPVPTKVTGIPIIKKIAAGWEHSLALTDIGDVWTTGRNMFGQLGLGHNLDETSFTRVSFTFGPIRDISCGGGSTALISEAGVFLMTGANSDGQLGLAGEGRSLCNFEQVPLSSPVAAVACGSNHTVALAVDGTVWAWGWGLSGQLGIGCTAQYAIPQKVIGVDKHAVITVIAGYSHTALLTANGNVLFCGRGGDGELGREKPMCTVATLMTKSPDLFVKQVAFAYGYTLMLVEKKTESQLL